MIDFEVQRCTRQCAATSREFEPGETFFSTLIPDGAETVRKDYCLEAWTGPTEEMLGWWKARMPDPKGNRKNWAPSDVMLDYFERLEDESGKGEIRYILALLMIRRRIFRLEDALDDETNDDDTLTVYSAKREKQFHVAIAIPSASRIEEIQNELTSLLH